MFSIKACYWNNDVYINEQHKFSVNEILTDIINKSFEDVYLYETKRNLKTLCKSLAIEEDKSYLDIENYNSNVYEAQEIFEALNEIISECLPFSKIFKFPIETFTDFLNNFSYIFIDGTEDTDIEEITWDTVTEYGVGVCDDSGFYKIQLHKFKSIYIEEDFKELDINTLSMIQNFNECINTYFNNYIGFIDSLIIIEDIFKPFIEDVFATSITFPDEYTLANHFDSFNKEHSFNFNNIDCVMTSFGYKSIKNENGKFILCHKIEFKDFQSFLFYDFFYGIKRKYIINRCKNCERFFLVQSGKYMSYCDAPLADDQTKTCRDVGAKRTYEDKCKNDPIWLTYNRAYKAHYARYMKKKMTTAQFEQWSRFASEIRDKAISGDIQFEDYYTKIRE